MCDVMLMHRALQGAWLNHGPQCLITWLDQAQWSAWQEEACVAFWYNSRAAWTQASVNGLSLQQNDSELDKHTCRHWEHFLTPVQKRINTLLELLPIILSASRSQPYITLALVRVLTITVFNTIKMVLVIID